MPQAQQTTDLQHAVDVLRAGGLVAIPTETVYGLAADARNPAAVARIFQVKRRPATHPLIVHIASPERISDWAANVPESAWQLAAAFCPGPLTLILKRRPDVLDLVTGGQDSIGLRVPRHPLTLKLLEQFGGGLAAPSANRFTQVSPTSAEDVAKDLGEEVDLILDGGPCVVGLESTILDLTQLPPVLLRPGAISLEAIAAVLETSVSEVNAAQTRVPGQHARHYAIGADVHVVAPQQLAAHIQSAIDANQKTLVLATENPLSENDAEQGVTWWPIPESAEAWARVLYRRFREADDAGFERVLLSPSTDAGIGKAINDRIRRASQS